jgi:hypothetical protein
MRRVNIWAVLVAGIVFWLVGGLWYAVLFGNQWMAAMGKRMDQITPSPVWQYALTFAMELVIAAAIAWVTSRTGELNVKRGVRVALGMWLGLVAPTFVITYGFEQRPWTLYWINIGQFLVGMLLCGLIVGAWTSKGAGNSSAAGA